jgi:dolichyl-phosphate beta-glucosyltransferase
VTETTARQLPLPGLSVVVPAYNEATRIASTLDAIADYCRKHVAAWEIVVVDDGSSDDTAEVARNAVTPGTPLVVLVNARNRGKGYSVKRGALAAAHPYVLLSDADLSTPIEEVAKLAGEASPGTIVIASRGMSTSNIEVHQPFYRETMGKVFNRIVQALLLPGISDSQCGFKLFGHDVTRAVFPALKTERFAFDVELLARAIRGGFQVREVPVTWRNDGRTRVDAVRDSAVMLKDVLRVWFMLRGS